MEKQRSESDDRLRSYLTDDSGNVILKKDGDAWYDIEQYTPLTCRASICQVRERSKEREPLRIRDSTPLGT